MRIVPILFLASLLCARDRPVTVLVSGLPFSKDVRLVEGSRGMDAAFPFIKGVTPKTLPDFIDGIRDIKQAAAAVRLFVAGPVVRTKAEAERIIATARKLQNEFKHLKPKVLDYRPESYAPSASKVEGSFEVSLVAYEMDRNLQLVHVVAKVSPRGHVELKRHEIVSGPMTSWQTAMIAMGDEDQRDAALRTEREMQAEAKLGRKRYAQALKPARSLDTAWAIARLAPTIREVEDLWGKPDEDFGSGLVIRGYTLGDGTMALFGAPGWDKPCVYVRHTKRLKPNTVSNPLYTGFSR